MTFVISGANGKQIQLMTVHPSDKIIKPLPSTIPQMVVWPDQWQRYPELCWSRISHFLELGRSSQRVHARETQLVLLNSAQANEFYRSNHILGPISCKYHFGLTYQDALVAALSVARKCPIHRNDSVFQSAEITRFSYKIDTFIPGGLSKLIRYARNEIQPDDFMTQIDLDLGDGSGFEKLGFKAIDRTNGHAFWIRPDTYERIYPTRGPESWSHLSQESILTQLKDQGYVACEGSGRLKMIQLIGQAP